MRTTARRGRLIPLALTVAAFAALALPTATPAAAAAPTSATDPTQAWNYELRKLFEIQGGAPGPLARTAAMMNGAIYDTVNSLAKARNQLSYQPYAVVAATTNPAAVDDESAVGFAARDLLIDVLVTNNANSGQAAAFKASIDGFFGGRNPGLNPDTADTESRRFADQAVNAMISKRVNDGSADAGPYTTIDIPGAWRPTGGPNCQADTDAATPNWGRVKMFTSAASNQFRPKELWDYATDIPADQKYERAVRRPALDPDHASYDDTVQDVREKGAAAGSTRTADETQQAFFWANDADGTYKPPGQLLAQTELIAKGMIGAYTQRQQRTEGLANARLYALVSFGMADALIAAWDAKYESGVHLWRPISAITIGLEGKPLDLKWQPLGPTPCFPAWVSGHSALAGAWASVLQSFFGSDTIGFKYRATTEDPNATADPGDPNAVDGFVTRPFDTFSAVADEDAFSRVFLGVHYHWDCADGLYAGRKAAEDVVSTLLQP